MNWSQLKTIIWLRWRLTRNQLARGGGLNTVIVVLGMVAGILLTIFALAGGFAVGWLALADASPLIMMLAWDGIAGVFLFAWVIGVLVEIQRAESIDLSKLFHLPMSMRGIFVMNYIASHVTLSLILFLPAAFGVCAGLVWSGKFEMILLIPLVLGFVFMITAWTYCLRGWLVALMVNPRRRRNVVVVITLAVVLMGQLPNLYINLVLRPGARHAHSRHSDKSEPATLEEMVPHSLMLAHDYVPVLWLPKGAMALAEDNAPIAMMCALGCMLLGATGLARAYHATMRFYLGQDTSGAPKKVALTKPGTVPKRNFLERRLPFLPDDVAALTLAFMRSMSRAPEIKMAMFSNVLILVVIVPVIFLNHSRTITETVQLFSATGLVSFTFFGLLMMMFNQFGYDRDGFRALILSPASRRHVLLAKNISMAPLALSIGVISLSVLTVFEHLPPLILAGALCKLAAMLLILSTAGNYFSIYVPYRITAGSLKPTKPPPKTLLLIFVTQLFFPLLMIPNFIPPLVGFALGSFSDWAAPLVDAALSFALLALAVCVYWLSLNGLGELLERREQGILLIVSREVE